MIEKGYTIPVLDKGYCRLVDWLGTDQRIVEAARVSYKSPSKGEVEDKKLLHYLFKNRHTSPFEQCSIVYNIKLPLFVQGQFVRHRTQKLNQMSARYTEMPDEFYIPKSWRAQDKKNKQGSVEGSNWNPKIDREYFDAGLMGDGWNDILATEALSDFCEQSYDLYQKMIDAGIAKEMARMILPQNLYTEIYTQFDLHNLMHLFRLRLDPHAQWEIRQYAQAIYDIFKELYPWCAEAYEKYKFELVEV